MNKDLRISESGKILEVLAESKTEIKAVLVGYSECYAGERQAITGRIGTYVKFAFKPLTNRE